MGIGETSFFSSLDSGTKQLHQAMELLVNFSWSVDIWFFVRLASPLPAEVKEPTRFTLQ